MTTPVTTQQQHPLRAAVRTFFQSWLPQLLAALVVIPLIIEAVVDEVNKHGVILPDWLGLAFAGILTACAITSAILARIMAIPAVDRLLERVLLLGSAPNAAGRHVSPSE